MNNLPPILRDWITQVQSKTTPPHIRDNYLMMLDNVSRVCREVVDEVRLGTRSMPLTKRRSKSKN